MEHGDCTNLTGLMLQLALLPCHHVTTIWEIHWVAKQCLITGQFQIIPKKIVPSESGKIFGRNTAFLVIRH